MKEGDIMVVLQKGIHFKTASLHRVEENGSQVWTSFRLVSEMSTPDECTQLKASWTEFHLLQAIHTECVMIQKRDFLDTFVYDFKNLFAHSNRDLLVSVLVYKNDI